MANIYKIMGTDGNEYGPISFEQIKQWILEKRVEKKTPVFPDGAPDWIFMESLPEFSPVFAAQPTAGSGLNAIIPYKNVRALTAYYCGVFAVIPILGIPLGLAGFVLGILALGFRRKNPTAGGAVHAWIGIVIGGFFGLLWLATIVWIGIMAHHHHR